MATRHLRAGLGALLCWSLMSAGAIAAPAHVASAHVQPSAEALWQQGRQAAAHGSLAEAVHYYRLSLARDPQRVTTLADLAGALTDLERWDEARTAFENWLARAPEDADALNGLGYVHYRQKAYAEAVACYRRALAQRDDPQFHLNLGLALLDQGCWGQAQDEFEATLAIDPNNYWALNDRGYALEQQGRLDDAAASYERACDLAKKRITAHLNYGGLLLQQNQPGEAAWIFRDALKRQDGSADAHLGFAMALDQLGMADAAYLETRVAVSLNPRNAAGFHLLASLYRQRHEWPHALAAIDRAIALNGRDASYHLMRGQLLEADGRTHAAMADYARYVALAPTEARGSQAALELRIWRETGR